MKYVQNIGYYLLALVFAVSATGMLTADSHCDACASDGFWFGFQAESIMHCSHESNIHSETSHTYKADSDADNCGINSCCTHSETECNCVETEFHIISAFVPLQQSNPEFECDFTITDFDFRIFRTLHNHTFSSYTHRQKPYQPPDLSVRHCSFLL